MVWSMEGCVHLALHQLKLSFEKTTVSEIKFKKLRFLANLLRNSNLIKLSVLFGKGATSN